MSASNVTAMAFTKLPNTHMKNILATLLLTVALASASDVIRLPLLNGPLVYTAGATAVNITPTTAGSATLYYTNSLGQVVFPNGTSNLVSGTWTYSAKTWPTALPAIAMVPVKATDYVSLSIALARNQATNAITFKLSKSFDGVRFITTNAVMVNFDSPYACLVPAAGVTNAHSVTVNTNIAGTWFTGVKAIRLDAIDIAAGNAAAAGQNVILDVSASTIRE